MTEEEKKKKAIRKQGTISLQGKDYLKVAHRVLLFRQEHPGWTVQTEFVMCGDIPAMKCTVIDREGRILSTSHKSIKANGRGAAKDHPMEVSETGSIGRALALSGYGTLGGDLDEGEVLADAPQKTQW